MVMKNGMPKWDQGEDYTVGLKAYELAGKYKKVLEPRIPSGLIEGLKEDVDTLGGLSAVLAGHVPEVGEILQHPSGWRIEVTEADEKRVHRLRLHPPVEADPEAPLERGDEF